MISPITCCSFFLLSSCIHLCHPSLTFFHVIHNCLPLLHFTDLDHQPLHRANSGHKNRHCSKAAELVKLICQIRNNTSRMSHLFKVTDMQTYTDAYTHNHIQHEEMAAACMCVWKMSRVCEHQPCWLCVQMSDL